MALPGRTLVPVNLLQSAFSAGELAPSYFARVDLDKFHSGVALMRNFFVDYRGGARNRAGTRWVGRSKVTGNVNVRLIRFEYNEDQTYALEFGDSYMRVCRFGGY